MRARALAALIAAGLLLAGCGASLPEQPEKRWTATDYAAAVSVNDDPLSTSVVVRSGGPRVQPVHPDVHQNDLRMMLTVDRRTGERTLAVVLRVLYSSRSWFMLSGASYVGDDGVARAGSNFARGYSKVSSCSRGTCVFEEHAAFGITEHELSGIVHAVRSGKRQSEWWPVRFSALGERLDFVIHVDEIEGFLRGMNAAIAASN